MSNMKLLMEDWRGFLNEQDDNSQFFYHLSPIKFDKFQQQLKPSHQASEPGFHFGTKKTALTVADKLKKEGRVKSGDMVYLYRVQLNMTNPLEMKENRMGSWGVNSIVNEMFEGESSFSPTDDQLDEFYEDVITTPSGENLKDLMFEPGLEVKEFISWLNNQGFDSIKYENTFEGGGDSYIVFKPEQVNVTDRSEYEIP